MITFWWEQMGILLEVGLMVVAAQPSGPVVTVYPQKFYGPSAL